MFCFKDKNTAAIAVYHVVSENMWHKRVSESLSFEEQMMSWWNGAVVVSWTSDLRSVVRFSLKPNFCVFLESHCIQKSGSIQGKLDTESKKKLIANSVLAV